MTYLEYLLMKSKGMQAKFIAGNGCIYLHGKPGKATHVLLTMERFEKEMGGYDPGHDESFNHIHLYDEEI